MTPPSNLSFLIKKRFVCHFNPFSWQHNYSFALWFVLSSLQTRKYTHARTHSLTLFLSHTHTISLSHTHTYPHILSLSLSHTHTHTHLHKHLHLHLHIISLSILHTHSHTHLGVLENIFLRLILATQSWLRRSYWS